MTALESFEEQLAEQTALHPNLYDPGHKYYKNQHVTLKSWREISSTLQTQPEICREKWKQLRDRYVRTKKKFNSSKSGNPGSRPARIPPLLQTLSWLDGYVKHRKTVTRHTTETPEGSSSSSPGPTQLLEDMVSPYRDKAQCATSVAPEASAHNDSQGPPLAKAGETQWLELLQSPSRTEDSPMQRCSSPIPQNTPFPQIQAKKKRGHDQVDPACTSLIDLLKDCSKMTTLRDVCAVQGDELDESHYFGIVVAKGLRALPDKIRADAMAQVMALLSNFRKQASEELQTNDSKES